MLRTEAETILQLLQNAECKAFNKGTSRLDFMEVGGEKPHFYFYGSGDLFSKTNVVELIKQSELYPSAISVEANNQTYVGIKIPATANYAELSKEIEDICRKTAAKQIEPSGLRP